MKTVKVISFIIAFVFIMSAFQIVSFAQADTVCNHCSGDITVIVDENASEEVKNKIYAHFYNSNNETVGQTKGLTCTLFGHDIETGSTTTITHKVRSTSPRCLKEVYSYEVCSRCEYSVYNRISSVYIVCCS